MGSIRFEELEVLVVSEIGKEISGAGMDPNVIGRMRIDGMHEPQSPRISLVVALGLSEATAGNGIGLGLADFTTLRAIGQLDLGRTYLNALTAGRGGLRNAFSSDRDADRSGHDLRIARRVRSASGRGPTTRLCPKHHRPF